MTKFIEKMISGLEIVSKFITINFILCHLMIGFVVPLMIQGVTLRNVLFWSVTTSIYTVVYSFIFKNLVYISVSWFLCKSHLDMQADNLIDGMVELTNPQKVINVYDIAVLNIRYKRLVTRIKQFDQLSQKLIFTN